MGTDLPKALAKIRLETETRAPEIKQEAKMRKQKGRDMTAQVGCQRAEDLLHQRQLSRSKSLGQTLSNTSVFIETGTEFNWMGGGKR